MNFTFQVFWKNLQADDVSDESESGESGTVPSEMDEGGNDSEEEDLDADMEDLDEEQGDVTGETIDLDAEIPDEDVEGDEEEEEEEEDGEPQSDIWEYWTRAAYTFAFLTVY